MKLKANQISNILTFLDRVQTRGIQEASALLDAVQTLDAMGREAAAQEQKEAEKQAKKKSGD